MDHLNSVIDISACQISIRKKSFVFKSSFHNRVKAHDTMTIAIKSMLSKQLRNGDFIGKPFHPFSNYLPLNFMLQLKKGNSYLKIANPTSHAITIKANTSLGSINFELIHDLSQSANTIAHIHQDMDGSCAMYPITQPMGSETDNALYSKHHTSPSHTIQSYALKASIYACPTQTTIPSVSIGILSSMKINMNKRCQTGYVCQKYDQ